MIILAHRYEEMHSSVQLKGNFSFCCVQISFLLIQCEHRTCIALEHRNKWLQRNMKEIQTVFRVLNMSLKCLQNVSKCLNMSQYISIIKRVFECRILCQQLRQQ